MGAYPRGMGDHITLGPFHGHEYPSEATLGGLAWMNKRVRLVSGYQKLQPIPLSFQSDHCQECMWTYLVPSKGKVVK